MCLKCPPCKPLEALALIIVSSMKPKKLLETPQICNYNQVTFLTWVPCKFSIHKNSVHKKNIVASFVHDKWQTTVIRK